MTENHHQDKEMLDEIERALNHQASSNELLTKLSQTIPKANTDFQNNLEDDLIIRLTQTTYAPDTGDKFMTEFNEKSKRKKNQPSRLPFTLVAAIIAIVLVGGLIFFTSINTSSEPYNTDSVPEGIALTATQIINDATATGIARNSGQTELVTATPDNFMMTATAIIEGATATAVANSNVPDNFSRIVIALRDIELNETITDEMVTTVQYDLEDSGWFMDEDNPSAIYFSNEGAVIGQRASTFIPYHQPVHSNNVTEAQNCVHEAVELEHLGCSTVDFGYKILTFHTNDAITDATPLVLPLGTRVDVITALQLIEIGDRLRIVDEDDLPLDIVPFIRMTAIVSDAILLNVEGRGDDMTITLALSEDNSVALEHILESNTPMYFRPHVDNSELLFDEEISSLDYPRTDDGLAIVSIPLTQINTDSVVNVGDIFDIQFSILPDEADMLSAMPTPQAGDVINHDTMSSINMTILEIEDSNVLYVGRGSDDFPNPAEDDSLFMSISVNPDDAWIVDWYSRNGANFNLHPRNR